MKIKYIDSPYWQHKETKQVVSFYGSVPFYTYEEKQQWELKTKKLKEMTDSFGNVTYHRIIDGKEIRSVEDTVKERRYDPFLKRFVDGKSCADKNDYHSSIGGGQ